MTTTEPRVARDTGLLNSSVVMAAGTVVSRITGFGRAAVIAAALGLSVVTADVFNIANVIPNMLYILVGGGVLNSVLVPALVRAIKNDADGGKAYSERLFSLTITVLGIATVLAVVAAPWIMRLVVDDSFLQPGMRPFFDNMVMFARFCLPQIFFYGLYVLIGQMLNAKGRFGPMMWAPILNNVIAIAVFGSYLMVFGIKAVEPFTDAEVLLLGLGSTLGVVAQAAVLIPVLRRTGFSLRFRTDWRGHGLSEAIRLGLWTFGFVAVNQLAYLFVVKVTSGASGLTGAEGAGYSVYANAMLIMMVPHSVITVSLATALLPRLSDLAADGQLDVMRERFAGAMRMCLAVIVPVAFLIAALAQPLTAMIFAHGAAAEQTGMLAITLMLLMPGLIGFTVHYLALRGFYAVQDTKTPFYTQIWVSAVMMVGAIVVSIASPANRLVTILLAAGYSVAYLVGSAVGLVRLQRRIGDLDIRGFLLHIARVAFPAAVAGGIAWLVWWGWVQLDLLGGLPSMLTRLGELILGGTVGLAVFVGLAYAMRIDEVRQGVTMVLSRLRGGGAPAQPAVDPGDLLEDTAEHALPIETGTLSIFRRQGPFDPEMTAEFFLDETMHGVPGFWETSAAPPTSGGGSYTAATRGAFVPVVPPGVAAAPSTWSQRAAGLNVDTQPELPPETHESLRASLAESDRAIAGRYRLEQLVDDTDGVRSWRAVDDVLRRSVFLQTVAADDPRSPEFSQAARRASTVADPRFLRVLDIGTEGVAYVVREWTPGRSLASLVAYGALPPDQAAAIGREVADALASAHLQGLSHRCLDPAIVFVTSDGAVKIGGLETDAAIHGPTMIVSRSGGAPVDDPAELDAVGIGSVLYAGLTARWPIGSAGGLPTAPRIEGRIASPRQVRPGVPRALDVVTDRAIGHAARHHATPLLTPAGIAAELNGSAAGRAFVNGYDDGNGGSNGDPPALIGDPAAVAVDDGDAPVGTRRRDRRESSSLVRIFGVIGGALLLVGSTLVGLQLLLGAFENDDDPNNRPPAVEESPTASPPADDELAAIPIADGGDFDPATTSDGEESPEDVPLAFDGDPETAWRTVTYYDAMEQQKDGVGIWVDLGEAQSISEVRLQFLGEDFDFELRVAPEDATQAPEDLDGWTSIATISESAAEATQTLDEPVTARYLLVWFTRLPLDDGNYRGGVAEVEVLG